MRGLRSGSGVPARLRPDKIQHLQGEPVRRLVVTSTVLTLATTVLAACGEDESADTGKVTVSGEFGEAPKVTYDGVVKREKTEIDVLTEGDGEVIEDGDSAFVEYYIGNGYSGEESLSSFEGDTPPEMLTFKKDQLLPAFNKAVIGQKVGSRIEVIAAPEDAFGEAGGNPDLGIGNADTVVFVIDILSKAEAKDVDASEVPKVRGKAGGAPEGFDFSASPKKAPAELLRATHKEGTGEEIEPGQKVKVRYLGSVWGSSKVFDETYSKGKDPIEVTVGAGGVIKGWDLGLVGTKVGSRIELVIPGDLAYGATGREPDIKPNDTLVFVMDIVSAS